MPKSEGFKGLFKMRQLPKPEYRLMQWMIAAYQLDDPAELFTVLLCMADEIQRMDDTLIDNGGVYIKRVINHIRSSEAESRSYAGTE